MAVSAFEYYILELINRARMDPVGEAARLGISLNQGLAPGTISSAPKQVLAMDSLLQLAADNHTKWMIANDQFTNQESPSFPSLRTGQTPFNRMDAAGYTFDAPPTYGEALSWKGSTGGAPTTPAYADELFRLMFLSPGMRATILDPDFKQAGVGQERGLFLRNGINHDAAVLTTDFAASGNKVFVTGVTYLDEPRPGYTPPLPANGDGKYTIGEGMGYSQEFTANQGPTTVSFGFPWYHPVGPSHAAVQLKVNIGATNIKIDIQDEEEVFTDTSIESLGIQRSYFSDDGGGGGSWTTYYDEVRSITALGVGNITLIGGSRGDIILRGNAGSNVLIGGSHNDKLSGLAGADLMRGGLGRDSYGVDSPGDVVDESTGDAISVGKEDSVISVINFNLSDSVHVKGVIENLTLTGPAVTGVGNTVNNRIVGNNVNNGLSGLNGNDTLLGGAGNDGLYGGNGNDSLSGQGGNDALTSGTGNDVFVYTGVPNALSNRDTFMDFNPAADVIHLSRAGMPTLGPAGGVLSPAYFRLGTKALDGNDHVIYNKTTGALFYDADGTGAAAQIQFATLTNKPNLTYQDFFVIA